MSILLNEKCIACRRDSPRVTEAEIRELTSGVGLGTGTPHIAGRSDQDAGHDQGKRPPFRRWQASDQRSRQAERILT
jgi:hypothetical protein